MQVELENLGKLERKLTIRIPADQLDQQVSVRLSRMGREVRLKGFRPGRVPRGVIEKRFGAQVRNEALSELINSSFRDAVQQEKLNPVAAPMINTSGEAEAGEIAYTATFEVFPELPAVDVSTFSVERPVAEVAESDIDEMVETLRRQRRTFEPVERAAAKDDMALFEFEADTSDGRFPAEGRERAAALLGSGQFNAAVEAALEGVEAGNDFAVEASFAEGFRVVELAGRLCQVRGTLVRVQAARLPDVDAAFFRAFGIEDGSEAGFRDEVRRNLERELAGALSARLRSAVAEALAAAHPDLDLPRVLVVGEVRAMLGMDPASTLTDGDFERLQPLARKRVTAGLLFGKIAGDEGIRVDDQRVGKALAAIASTYEEPEQVVELYRSNPDLMAGLRNRVLDEQVAEWIAERAQCTDKVLSFGEIMKPAAAV